MSANALEEHNKLERFNQHRGLLFSVAYRMLGSASDAEDIVQEAFLRWNVASEEEVRSPRSYLTTVVTRLCIDQLRSARARREVYIGPWLPEPLLTDGRPDLAGTVELAESISTAFLLLLESLGPVERAVFLLREVFSYEYNEIASVVGKTEANCRQMVARARQHVRANRPRFPVSREKQEGVVHKFIAACAGGDMAELLAMLTDDVVLLTDSGGNTQAARKPVHGSNNVSKFLLGVLEKTRTLHGETGFTFVVTEVNGAAGLVTYVGGETQSVLTLETDGERISALNIVLNPDKLPIRQ